jgi:hypothetical protein
MAARNRAKELLVRFEAQTKELNQWKKAHLDCVDFEDIKEVSMPEWIERIEKGLVEQFRGFCRELFSMLEHVDKTKMRGVKAGHWVLGEVLEDDVVDIKLFMDLVKEWSDFEDDVEFINELFSRKRENP